MNQGIYEELVTKLVSFKLGELDKDTFQVKTTSIGRGAFTIPIQDVFKRLLSVCANKLVLIKRQQINVKIFIV